MSAQEKVNYTKSQAFPDGPVLSMENFAGEGSVQQGIRTWDNIGSDNQKSLQESYRAGLSASKAGHDSVEGR